MFPCLGQPRERAAPPGKSGTVVVRGAIVAAILTGMTDVVFNEAAAEMYDAASASMYAPGVLGPAVDFLAGIAGDGAALEMGIGTGRVALPLSERGVRVHGIDISAPMVAKMMEKRGAGAIGVTIGDFSTTRVAGQFSLVYLAFNVITNLETQADQVACFRNAAEHLEPGGAVVIEVLVPELQRLPRGERFLAFDVTREHLGFDVYDVVEQTCTSHHYYVNGDRVQFFKTRHRYAWPMEFDLMAQMAGLELEQRWATWTREPFTAESRDHISVWRKPR
jgi:hypothetical protein